MDIYYIYEIPGVKVGCTKNLKKRMQRQEVWNSKQYKVLGAANNIQDAADMEREWQIKLGYKIDKNTYDVILKNQQKCLTPEAQAKRVANTNWEEANKKRIANTNLKEASKKRVANIDWKTSRAKSAEKCKKAIIVQNLNTNKIFEFDSIIKANSLLNIDRTSIYAVLNGKKKQCKGFTFKYKN